MTTTTWKTPSSTEISELFQHAAREVDTFHYLADENSRKKALTTAQSLVAALQRPEDVVMRYAWEVLPSYPLQASLADVGLRMGLNACLYAWV